MDNDNKNADHIMPSPVVTRWWTVGQAVRYILKNIAIFKEVPKYFIYGSKTKKLSAAASNLFSLLKEKGIIADMMLINNFLCALLASSILMVSRRRQKIGRNTWV